MDYLQVLLGEGYYAERTSKQTVEILQRRGKVLESQVESLKAIMLDLKTEASFFDSTASEAAVSIEFFFYFVKKVFNTVVHVVTPLDQIDLDFLC